MKKFRKTILNTLLLVSLLVFATTLLAPMPAVALVVPEGPATSEMGDQEQGSGQILDYVPLAPISGTTEGNCDSIIPNVDCKTNLTVYLIGMFKILIGVAGVLAVIMIVIGGIRYMSTDAVYGKSDGKDMIKQALGGLLLALIAWLILFSINPNLINTELDAPATLPPSPPPAQPVTYQVMATVKPSPPPPSNPNFEQIFCSGEFPTKQECIDWIPGFISSLQGDSFVIQGEPSCVQQCTPATSQIGLAYTTEVGYTSFGQWTIECIGTYGGGTAVQNANVCNQASGAILEQFSAMYPDTQVSCSPVSQCNPTP